MTSPETNKAVPLRKKEFDAIAHFMKPEENLSQAAEQTAPQEISSPKDESRQHDALKSAETPMSLRRKVAIGSAAGIVAVGVGGNILAPEVADSASEVESRSIISTTGEATIGGEDTGWDQGAAERAIKNRLNDKDVEARMDAEHIDYDMLSYYSATIKAVEIARKDGVISQKDDLMKVYFDVIKKSDKEAFIKVTGAEIIPAHRNQ